MAAARSLCPILLLIAFMTVHWVPVSSFDPIGCAIDSAAAVAACSAQMDEDVKQHGGKVYCCIVAKFQYCLTGKLGDSCGSGIQSLVDKAMTGLVFDESSGCKDYKYLSPQCILFYYWPFAAVIGGVCLLVLAAVIVVYILRNVLMCSAWLVRISCKACAGCCCPSCLPDNKYQRQYDLVDQQQRMGSVVIRGQPAPVRIIPNISHSVNSDFRPKDETPLVQV
jgi:hypothetical protein